MRRGPGTRDDQSEHERKHDSQNPHKDTFGKCRDWHPLRLVAGRCPGGQPDRDAAVYNRAGLSKGCRSHPIDEFRSPMSSGPWAYGSISEYCMTVSPYDQPDI